MSQQQKSEQKVIAIRVMMADAAARDDKDLALEACKAVWAFVDANPEFQVIAPIPTERVRYQMPTTVRQMTARYGGRCGVCEGPVARGDIMYWDHADRIMICARCSISELMGTSEQVRGCSK